MKKVLVVSYRFPPQLTTRSVQVARWVKYLPRYDWEPVVVHADENTIYNTPIDYSMNSLIPAKIQLIRVKSFEPRLALALAAKAAPFLLSLPDTAIGWYRPAYKKSLDILKNQSFDLLFSCAYARTSNLVGLKLKRETGLPWVAYFSDPWLGSASDVHNPVTRYINGRMERAVIKAADAVIFISEGMRQRFMEKYPTEWMSKAHIISQCFDPDLVAMFSDDKNDVDKAKFTIVFAGNLYGRLRDLMPLFKAIRNIVVRQPEIFRSLKVQMVGKIGDTYKKMVAEYGIENVVSIIDTKPYLESLSYMAKADALLSFDSPSEISSQLHTSKVAEYLGFKKPILAVTPLDASWVSVIKRFGGIVVQPNDINGIEQAILTLHRAYNEGNLVKYSYKDEDIKPYSATNIVAGLTKIFNDTSGNNSKAI
ncbi:glycosyltransferase [Chloroflexota bacterium]